MYPSLKCFHPISRQWFLSHFDTPTEAQVAAWPKIADREHLLVCAPTGSGKTLTAFFYAIDGLLSGRIRPGGVRILYVSPLKALNNDIRRNLLAPLDTLSLAFRDAGQKVPKIRVMTRSGDTPESERRRMSGSPPEILITTPESLNILLTSKRGAAILRGIETVILDEIHAVADNKRGTYLMTAVERLTRLSGEFQRIALSATVTPLETVARFVGGYIGDAPRRVQIVSPASKKRLSLSVQHADPIDSDEEDTQENPSWRGAAAQMASHITSNQSTLIFANSRRGVERLSRIINEICGTDAVYAHHGSLSKEIRLLVEERLKQGALQGVVATSSLELGIDIGHIDEVLMLESPLSVAATLQRLGRAGHGVGEESRGAMFVLYPQDALNAAIIAREVSKKQVEPIVPPAAPLDVLAQVILSTCAQERWSLDDLFTHLKNSDPYHRLKRRLFDLVVEMLSGRYAGDNIPSLRPRIQVDEATGTVKTLESATRLLYRSGGTIPDRGYYSVRHQETRSLIGELDEEFVWERKIGDVITLGVQSWRITEITYSDVLVAHYKTGGSQTPFWRCEERMSSAYFADLRSAFLETADQQVGTLAFFEALQADYLLDRSAATLVIDFLKAEKRALGVSLPHRHHVVVEKVAPGSHGEMAVTIIHTEWGGKVNRPFAIALQTALRADLDGTVQVMADDGAVAITMENDLDADLCLNRVTAENVVALVREGVEQTGLFGAVFRENAARALLILRAGFGKRTPLWLNRKRAKELREKTAAFTDFPINLETYRTVLQDEADLPALQAKLDELQSGRISVSVVRTHKPSPFAESLVYKLTNELMYDDDRLEEAASQTTDALIDAVLFSDALRPRIHGHLVDTLARKLKRLHEGYAPSTPLELIAWIEERRLIPRDEWRALLRAMRRDHGLDTSEICDAVAHRVVAVLPDPDAESFVTTVSALCDLERIFEFEGHIRDAEDPSHPAAAAANEALSSVRKKKKPNGDLIQFLREWLRFEGPLAIRKMSALLPIDYCRLKEALAVLRQEETVVVDQITDASPDAEVCHADIFRILLRMMRAASRQSLSLKSLRDLPGFMAAYQGLGAAEGMEAILESLFGYPAPPAFFEHEIFPARMRGYRKADLDALLAGSNLQWVGCRKEVIFSLAEDRILFYQAKDRTKKAETTLKSLFLNSDSHATLAALEKRTGIPGADLTKQLHALATKGMVNTRTFNLFRAGATDANTSPKGRPRFSKWKRGDIDANVYVPLTALVEMDDALDREGLDRERVRVLLGRYGVLFKALLDRELPELRWSALFKTLRLMELSQEIVGGYFFKGIPGIQFISQRALSMLQSSDDDAPIFWLNAKDPISLCGLGLKELDLPPRVAGTHLVYRGSTLMVVSKRHGKHLTVNADENDPRLPEYFTFIEVMLSRDVSPLPLLTIEKINGKDAAQSPYRPVLTGLFDASSTHRTLTLARRFG